MITDKEREYLTTMDISRVVDHFTTTFRDECLVTQFFCKKLSNSSVLIKQRVPKLETPFGDCHLGMEDLQEVLEVTCAKK